MATGNVTGSGIDVTITAILSLPSLWYIQALVAHAKRIVGYNHVTKTNIMIGTSRGSTKADKDTT
jgi:hypothetical protein